MTNKEEARKRLSIIEEEAKSIRMLLDQPDKPQNVMEVIKTFDQACNSKHVTKEDLWFMPLKDQMPKSSYAMEQIRIISKALNEGVILTLNDTRWYPWFRVSSGFVFDDTSCDASSAYTASASALCFKSSKLAEYAGKQFIEIYKEAMS
jgi:hypothetical protein